MKWSCVLWRRPATPVAPREGKEKRKADTHRCLFRVSAFVLPCRSHKRIGSGRCSPRPAGRRSPVPCQRRKTRRCCACGLARPEFTASLEKPCLLGLPFQHDVGAGARAPLCRLVDPRRQLLVGDAGGEALPLQPRARAGQGLKRLRAAGDAAAARGAEGTDGEAVEAAALHKGGKDARRFAVPYCVSKLIQSTSCGYRFSIYQIATRYALIHSSPRTHMVLGIVF